MVEQEVGHGSDVYPVAWSPLGTKVATGGSDGQLRIVDAASGVIELEVLHMIHDDVLSVAWSP